MQHLKQKSTCDTDNPVSELVVFGRMEAGAEANFRNWTRETVKAAVGTKQVPRFVYVFCLRQKKLVKRRVKTAGKFTVALFD